METTVAQELINRKKESGTYLAPLLKLSPDLVRLRNEPSYAKSVNKLIQKYPTFNDFAIANTPSRQISLCQDPEQCTYGDSPWLRLLDVTYGRFASAIWLVPQIADISVCCGLKEDASEAQIKLVATAIASKYKYLKTDEVMLFYSISRPVSTNDSIVISILKLSSKVCQVFFRSAQTSLMNMTER